MAIVLRVRHRVTGHLYALKLLEPLDPLDPLAAPEPVAARSAAATGAISS